MSRSMLEYHLDTLTNRNQEAEFERFAKRLCEFEICPNLLPHTGPSGGGDSKVDSETYPVSDTTSLGWFSGIGREAANERWGFAFSTKADWVSKVRDDIKKIHGTRRGYKVAYFVSSKFIRDKKRAEIEDELTEKYNVDVRILDRNWILDTVFGKKLMDIAAEELNIEFTKEEKIKKGPLDIQKEEILNVLNREIKVAISEDQITQKTVDDSIAVAILSRELEKDRAVIDQQFARAERLAIKYGNDFQQFEVAYQFARTNFWWHEDVPAFIDLYPKVEERVLETENIYNLERLEALWCSLKMLRYQNKGLVDISFFDKHTRRLREKLKEISIQQDEKPSASLHAKTLLLEMELQEKISADQDVGRTLNDLKEVVTESRDLVGFPFRGLILVLTEISAFLENYSEYSALFNTIIRVVEERDGEISVARLLLDRGNKQLSLDLPYKAIQTLGLAIRKLYKQESRDDVVRCLYLCSLAYEKVGLLWAARGVLLSAASLATSELWVYGEINTMQALCYRRLKWLELKLGRVPQALEWHQLDYAMRNALLEKGFENEKLFEQINTFDLALGIVLLKADPRGSIKIQYLPDVLAGLGLEHSKVALIYALGCEDKMPKDFIEAVPHSEMDDFFAEWANHPSFKYLSINPNHYEEENIELSSKILGCEIKVLVENQQPCLEIGESILAAIESFLSTSILGNAIAREPILEINVGISLDTQELAEHEVNDDADKPIISILCKKFNPHNITRAEQEKLRDFIFGVLVDAIVRIVIFKDPEKTLEEIMRDERAPERSLNFTSSFITIGNVLGYQPKTRISDWIDTDKTKYAIKRGKPLVFKSIEEDQIAKEQFPEKPRKTPLSSAKHSEIQTISVIRETHWNDAKWFGVGYAVSPNAKDLPVFSILFENIEAGRKIFSAWRKKFGDKDNEEQIRITIIRGIDRDNIHNYRAAVGSSMKKPEELEAKFTVSVSRLHTMTPQSSQNLENFISAYKVFHSYILAPGYAGEDGLPSIIFGLGIIKKEINIKEAWSIGLHDTDAVAIDALDKPIVPSDIKAPPVLELLEARKKWLE